MDQASGQAVARVANSPVAIGAATRRLSPPLELVETPPPGVRARQLYQEARAASLDHLTALETAIATVRDLADAVVESGDLYGPGLNDFAQRLSQELFWRSKTLQKLSLRQSELVRAA